VCFLGKGENRLRNMAQRSRVIGGMGVVLVGGGFVRKFGQGEGVVSFWKKSEGVVVVGGGTEQGEGYTGFPTCEVKGGMTWWGKKKQMWVSASSQRGLGTIGEKGTKKWVQQDRGGGWRTAGKSLFGGVRAEGANGGQTFSRGHHTPVRKRKVFMTEQKKKGFGFSTTRCPLPQRCTKRARAPEKQFPAKGWATPICSKGVYQLARGRT